MQFWLGIVLCLLCACGKERKERIALDPSFSRVQLFGKEDNVFAFMNELCAGLAKETGIQFERLDMNFDDLIWGLEQQNYTIIVSGLYPYVFYDKRYSFSNLILNTGGVLVTRVGDRRKSYGVVAVGSDSGKQELMQHFPTAFPRIYTSVPEGLDLLMQGRVDAAIVPAMAAQGYVQDLYARDLEIHLPPLSNVGLRFITLHSDKPVLIKKINRGMKRMRESGEYARLLKKWNLSLDS